MLHGWWARGRILEFWRMILVQWMWTWCCFMIWKVRTASWKWFQVDVMRTATEDVSRPSWSQWECADMTEFSLSLPGFLMWMSFSMPFMKSRWISGIRLEMWLPFWMPDWRRSCSHRQSIFWLQRRLMQVVLFWARARRHLRKRLVELWNIWIAHWKAWNANDVLRKMRYWIRIGKSLQMRIFRGFSTAGMWWKISRNSVLMRKKGSSHCILWSWRFPRHSWRKRRIRSWMIRNVGMFSELRALWN